MIYWTHHWQSGFPAVNSELITAQLIGRFYLSHQDFLPSLLTVIHQQDMQSAIGDNVSSASNALLSQRDLK